MQLPGHNCIFLTSKNLDSKLEQTHRTLKIHMFSLERDFVNKSCTLKLTKFLLLAWQFT